MNRALRRQQLKEPKGGKDRPATSRPIARPSTQRPAQRREGRRGILSWRPQFIADIFNELRKVVWPTREDVVYLTIVVVIVTLIIGAVLGAIDLGFGWLVERTLLS